MRLIFEVTINPFPQRGAAVTAIETQLIDQYMRERVNHHKLWTDWPLLLSALDAAQIVAPVQPHNPFLNFGIGGLPLLKLCCAEFQKQPFATHNNGGKPVDPRIEFQFSQTVASDLSIGRQNACET